MCKAFRIVLGQCETTRPWKEIKEANGFNCDPLAIQLQTDHLTIARLQMSNCHSSRSLLIFKKKQGLHACSKIQMCLPRKAGENTVARQLLQKERQKVTKFQRADKKDSLLRQMNWNMLSTAGNVASISRLLRFSRQALQSTRVNNPQFGHLQSDLLKHACVNRSKEQRIERKENKMLWHTLFQTSSH